MKEIPIFEEVLQRLVRQPDFWMKMLIGGLFSFIPVVNFLAFGFLYRLGVQVQNQRSMKLPEWADWKGLFNDGTRLFIVWLFYWLIPILMALFVSMLLGLIGLQRLATCSFPVFSCSFPCCLGRRSTDITELPILRVFLKSRGLSGWAITRFLGWWCRPFSFLGCSR